MIHVALCNNDASYISEIESLLHGIAMQEKLMIHTDIFYNGTELEEKFRTGADYPLIILDADTEPGGLLTAKKLRNAGVDSLILFISHSAGFFLVPEIFYGRCRKDSQRRKIFSLQTRTPDAVDPYPGYPVFRK